MPEHVSTVLRRDDMLTTKEILSRAQYEKRQPVPDHETRCLALKYMADCLLAHEEEILKANAEDVMQAKGKITDVMLDRLRLNDERLQGMADGVRSLIDLPDPAGRILSRRRADKGIDITKVSVPFGLIAIIYESRPNVTSDAAALCLKSGNTAVLRSGKEAWNSAHAIVTAMREGLSRAGIHPDRIQLIEDRTHASANELMTADGIVDLLIPRGGRNLIRRCVENATVPVIETGTGICHVFVNKDADQDMALNIIENAKTSRPSVCNAEEVLLVHEAIADEFLPKLYRRLVEQRKAKGLVPVELRLDQQAAALIPGTAAGKDDFDTEFLDYILAVHIVKNTEEAIAHINTHGTHHSDAILTFNQQDEDAFTSRIDSACVYVNASTRFTDGGEFGLGCEMGISTQKLHARGPMGLEELCTYKYIIHGSGQIR